jgi:hypothetical protein
MVAIWRDITAHVANVMLNDPAIRPTVESGTHALDLSAAVANRDNLLLMGEHGGMLFAHLMPGLYEQHTFIRPAGRGEWSLDFCARAWHWMFTRTPCTEIITRIPAGHRAAMAAAVRVGFKPEVVLQDQVEFRGRMQNVHIYGVRLQDWLPVAPGLTERGEWLHQRMQAEADRLMISVPPHDDDPVHNIYAGAAVDMMFGEQPGKAVAVYNRYALIARHQPVFLLAANRVKFDIGIMVFRDGDIEVLPCA